jgi:hypothetical protein
MVVTMNLREKTEGSKARRFIVVPMPLAMQVSWDVLLATRAMRYSFGFASRNVGVHDETVHPNQSFSNCR